MDQYEVIVVGGSFAGLSAAMQLARARRRLLVVDAGRPRNRFAPTSHGFLGQDGVPPADIMREGLTQLSRYPTVDFIHAEAASAGREDDGLVLALSDGAEVRTRKLILATGVKDALPLDSMVPRWGVSVLHCPYCHGYEVRDRRFAVIANAPGAAHQAVILPDWGPTTFYTQGVFEPSGEEAGLLAARGVGIERTPVTELLGEGSEIRALRLADGREVSAEVVFTAPSTRMASPLAEQLGCAFADGMTGPYIEVDSMQQTSAPGVFAAGDAATSMYNATLASAAGVMAGVAAHRALVLDAAHGALRHA
ncbi:MAG: NAD(P)/FAD-dependent oxidoreductase [Phenylobacterium sp.]|uniref:NAD(P)/FAD-dependent oxidoreductase n=1 Tax=Phenylobacterium sp. TaxID=1871053 RepID=UPI0027245150|nr:NAD(P)/FAD-dependent oxidoreductase [Phenylobacterium sp.]MDO9433399.1 NAD(P)/FAD-dependent oxidoreductase [Phenylobacterium sp.]